VLAHTIRCAVQKLVDECMLLAVTGEYHRAGVVCDSIVPFISNITGGVNADDIRLYSDDGNTAAIDGYLNIPAVRKAIGADTRYVYTACNRTVRLA